LIISGYFDETQLATSITDAFGYLPQLPKPNRDYLAFPLDKKIKLNKVQDREGSTSKVVLGLRMALPTKNSLEGTRLRLEQYVIRKLLRAQIRLNKRNLPESVSSMVAVLKEATNERLVLAFSAVTTKHHDGLKAMLEEMERLRRYGFSADALQQAIDQTKKTAQRNVLSAKKRSFAKWEDTITNAVMTDGIVLEATEKLHLTNTLLDSITLKDINQRLVEILNADDIFIYYQAPSTIKLTLPTVQQVTTWAQAIHSTEVMPSPVNITKSEAASVKKQAPRATVAAITLPVAAPQTQTVGSPNRHHEQQSVYEWHLKNGNKVVWLDRPTTSGNIQLKAMSDIGASNHQHAKWLTNSALQVFEQSAPAGITLAEWHQWQKENDAQWKFKLHPQHLDLSITAHREQLEAAFLAFWLIHQHRDFDNEAVAAVKKSVLASQETTSVTPLSALRYGIEETRDKLIKQADALTISALSKTANEVVNQPHTLFIVGEMEIATLEKLIGTYLSPLVNDKKLTAKYTLQQSETQHVSLQRIGEKKTRTILYGSTPLTWTPEKAFMLSTLNPIIQRALSKRLRLELAGVYRVAFEMKINPDTSYVESELSFISDPKRADELATAAQKVLMDLEPAINTENLPRIKEDIQFAEQDRLTSSSTWVRRLMLSYRKYNDPRYLASMLTLPDQLTRSALIDLSQQILPMQDQMRVDIQYAPAP